MTTHKCATLHLHTPLLTDRPIKNVAPHILPCMIHHDGPANVSRYFHVQRYKHDASQSKEYASLRARDITTTSSISVSSTYSSTKNVEANENGKRPVEKADTEDEDALHEAYFRGRKLVGKKLVLPEGYKGLILPVAPSSKDIPPPTTSAYCNSEEDDEEEEEEHEQEHRWNSEAEFKELFVWDHDAIPDGVRNPWIAGINEWISFAKWIHCEDE
ncbi:ribonuclease H2, subunit C [Lipomyces orientalis]|uniref:Ribonuclease H2, subunit C n=1 Tax=Lipomyces orientalis TaxID=1233043 RepID=A0ACC3TV61_9ASCO